MPTTVPASSWRLADGYHSEARRTLILAAFDLVFQAEFRAKKTPPVSGWRSNYAHLTDINLQDLCHRNVKRVHSVFTGGSADSSLIPQAGRKIQTSAGRNGLQINSQLIRVSKHSIVSHRSPAIESGIFLLSEKFESEVAIELASVRRHGSLW